jgi:Na+-transporting NADH:ubiquinone oxidoreductase subunit C
MMYQGELTEPTSEEKYAAILHASGLLKSDEHDKKTIKNLYQRYILARKVNLDSGEWVADDVQTQGCKNSLRNMIPRRSISAVLLQMYIL